MILEPKREFLKTPQASKFADAISTPEFRRGVEVALLQYEIDQHNQVRADSESAKAEAVAWRISGAVAFAQTLLTLADVREDKPRTVRQNLET